MPDAAVAWPVTAGPPTSCVCHGAGSEGDVTENGEPLLAAPATVTATLPLVAPLGTGATMLVALQLVGVAVVPLNLTVLAPWVAPKLVPVIVTAVPTGPDAGDRLVMLGTDDVMSVKGSPLLSTPPTVTTTLPLVAAAGTDTTMLAADQLVGVADVPLNLTRLVPCVAPKLVPEIVTLVPTALLAGETLVSVGPVDPGVSKNTSVEGGLNSEAVLYARTTKK